MDEEASPTQWALWLLGFFALLSVGAMGAWMNRTIDHLEQAQAQIVILQRDVDVMKERFATIDGRLGTIQSGIDTILGKIAEGRGAHGDSAPR